MTDDRVFVTTLFLRLNPKSTVADARPKRKMPGPNAARTARKKPRIMKPRKLSIRLVSPMLLVDSQGPQNLRFVPCATNPVTSFLVEAEELDKWDQESFASSLEQVCHAKMMEAEHDDNAPKFSNLFSWWPPGHANTALFVSKGHHQVVLRALLRALKRSSLSRARERTRELT
jgi:hypothetical protein